MTRHRHTAGVLCRSVWVDTRLLVCLALGCLALVQGAQAQQQNPTALLEPLKGVSDGAAILGQQLVGHFVYGTHNVLGKAEKDISSLLPPKHATSSTLPAATTTSVILTSTPPSTPGAASTTPQASTPLPSTIPATTLAAAASTPPPTTPDASSTAPESSAVPESSVVPPATSAASSTAPDSSTVPPTTVAASSTTALVPSSSVPPSTTVAASTFSIPPSTTQAATSQPPTTTPGPVPLHGYRVLATGGQNVRGILKTAELYSDLTGKWTATGMMTATHRLFNIVRLLDGRALLAGGININAIVLPGGAAFVTTNPGTTITELFNATSGSWAQTGKMTTPRTLFQMVVLQTGNVHAAGGCLDPTDYSSCYAQASAEVFRPGAGAWTATGNMSTSRIYFQMVALRNGKALAAGGFAQVFTGARYRYVPLSSAEIYDPLAGNWTSTGSMSTTRIDFKMVMLPDGRVLAAGGTPDNYNINSGFPNTLNSSEIYDPATGVWTPTRSHMMSGRVDLQMVSLLNGNVLVAGGYDYSAQDNVYTAEVYDYRLGMWNATGSPYAPPGRTSRFDFLMVALPDGNALAAGGYSTDANYNLQALTTSEVYNTTTGIWALTGSSTANRVDFGMVVL